MYMCYLTVTGKRESIGLNSKTHCQVWIRSEPHIYACKKEPSVTVEYSWVTASVSGYPGNPIFDNLGRRLNNYLLPAFLLSL